MRLLVLPILFCLLITNEQVQVKWNKLNERHHCSYWSPWFHVSFSTASKDWSTVNYCQSLAFDYPCLSCYDPCDQWLFQEIFFCYFQKQMFLKTGVVRNFAIITGKHMESLFDKITSLTSIFLRILQNFYG